MNKTLFYLLLPFMPHYWLMNNPYCKDWDITLNRLLSKYNFTEGDQYTAYLGQNLIWIANHPFASMTPYEYTISEFRPSRYTIYKAYKKIKKDIPQSKSFKIIDSINKSEGF